MLGVGQRPAKTSAAGTAGQPDLKVARRSEVLRQAADGRLKPTTPQELREALRESSKAAQANRVDIIVLDVTRPSPASTKSA